MSDAAPEQLRFAAVEGLSVRGHFDGGALSTDLGPLILRGVDRQIGLTERLAAAFEDKRHPGYITHDVRSLFAQRIFQVACAYEDANDANPLRRDPRFKLGVERRPLEPDNDLASGPTFSRLENAASAKDIYRLARAFVDQFIASYAAPPQVIVIDMDHSEDATYGQQEFNLYTPTTAATATYRCSCSRGCPASSSPPPCARANAPPGPRMPGSSGGCSSACGPPGPPPTSCCAATDISPPPSGWRWPSGTRTSTLSSG